MRKALAALLLVLSAMVFPSAASAEEAVGEATLRALIGRIVLVRTQGGAEIQGTLLSVSEERLEIVGGEGLIELVYRPSLASIAEVAPLRRGGEEMELYFRDAASNRLVVMPLGFGMEPKEFHVTAQEIVIVTMSYGFSERLSVWGGISIPGGLANLRYSMSLGEAGALSLGSFVGMTWTDSVGALMPYAILSLGKPDRNITGGLALPFTFSSSRPFEIGGILAAFGGKTIVSRTASIISETWLFYGSDEGRWQSRELILLPALVFRIAGGRLSWDIGALCPFVVTSTENGLLVRGLFGEDFVPLPILSLTYRLQ